MTRRGASLIAGLLALGFASGCSRAADVSHCAGVIYISVAADGTISVDGSPVEPSVLNQKLAQLRPSADFVMYYRENPQAEPQGEQAARVQEVLDAMVRIKLPISLSSRPDFSDSVTNDGAAPRTSCPKKV